MRVESEAVAPLGSGMPRLLEACYVRDFVIWLRFSDGAEGEVDLAGELAGPVFEPLRDPSYPGGLKR